MTTYYLKSQTEERLATDSNLSNQIKVTPQAAYTPNGGSFSQTSISQASGVSTKHYSVPLEKYNYLSVKNTGSDEFLLHTAELVGTWSGTATQNGSKQGQVNTAGSFTWYVTQYDLATQNSSSLDAIIDLVPQTAKSIMATDKTYGMEIDPSIVEVKKQGAPNNDYFVFIQRPGLTGTYTSLNIYVRNVYVVSPGQTVLTKANFPFEFDESKSTRSSFMVVPKADPVTGSYGSISAAIFSLAE